MRNLALALVLAAGLGSAGAITLNFDSVVLAGNTCTNGASYFASFGVTFSAVSAGTSSVICKQNFIGSATFPVSGSNLFAGNPR